MQKEWRGHRITCCANGTSMETHTGQKIWVAQRPAICDVTSANEKSAKSKSSKILKGLIILGTLMLCAGCCLKKFPYRKVWQMLSKCCASKIDGTEQEEGIEIKVIKKEASPKLARSRSF